MKMTRFFMFLMVMSISYAFVPFTLAQIGEISDEGSPTQKATVEPKSSAAQVQEIPDEEPTGSSVGIQASTNFAEMLVGMKVQMNDFAITPKFGFFYQSLKNVEGNVYNFGVGCGFDYYLSEGKLRPYVGGDFLIYIPHSPGNTDVWFVVSPHLGAEYWLSKSFSLGGNIGLQFGVGDSFYTPNTIGFLGNTGSDTNESDFSIGINGLINLTYYF